MDIILTESQYIKVLQESKENAMSYIFTNSKNFTKKIIEDVKKQIGIYFFIMGIPQFL